ncbi:hypothetical protein ACQEVB_01055 [Pseudonocardia sp. CA-107938]|uniref:hypothetical protein n=1 Tax=Pseudonocardia sp. CA-107938 TaxID=3240021 RepID=UPI003D8B7441
MESVREVPVQAGTMTPLVTLIVSQPGMAGRLIAQHRDDGTGRCTACQLGAQAGRSRWPCSIYAAAAAAEEVRADGAEAR